MASENAKGKRKVAQRDIEEPETEILDGLLEGVFSESEDEAEERSSVGEEDESDQYDKASEARSDGEGDDVLDSDEIPSDGDETSGDKDDAAAEDDEDIPNYRVTTDANGGVRYEYDEIDPVYDSDDTDAQGPVNTIGNIPLSFYDSYPHIGYDINGKKIMRPAAGEALDALLDSIELPKGWTGLTDPSTGKPLNLSQEELELLRRVQQQEIPEEGYDPYPDTVEYFTSIEEKMPLSSAPEPKRRFVPSKHEQKRVMKLVRAIREGRILPYKPPEEREKEEEEAHFDLWHDEVPTEPHIMHIPAPKLPPPGHDARLVTVVDGCAREGPPLTLLATTSRRSTYLQKRKRRPGRIPTPRRERRNTCPRSSTRYERFPDMVCKPFNAAGVAESHLAADWNRRNVRQGTFRAVSGSVSGSPGAQEQVEHRSEFAAPEVATARGAQTVPYGSADHLQRPRRLGTVPGHRSYGMLASIRGQRQHGAGLGTPDGAPGVEG